MLFGMDHVKARSRRDASSTRPEKSICGFPLENEPLGLATGNGASGCHLDGRVTSAFLNLWLEADARAITE
jgi:hypothetical protein